VLTLWRFVSLPDLSQHRLRAFFPLVGIALGVAVFIAVRVTNISTLGAFARTVDAIAGRAGLEITGRGAVLDETVLPLARRVPGVAAVAPLVLADVVVPEAGGAVLLVAMLAIVFSISRGAPASIPFDKQQELELLMTLGQALVARRQRRTAGDLADRDREALGRGSQGQRTFELKLRHSASLLPCRRRRDR